MAEGTPQPAAVPEQPIAENEQVKALLALLKDNNTPGYEEFAKLIGHVSEMEQRLSEATEAGNAGLAEPFPERYAPKEL